LKKKIAVVPKPELLLKRWSYSAWALYEECGLHFKARYVDKAPEPPSPAMARGNDAHTKAEYWLKGKLPGPVPRGLQKLEAQFNGLRAMGDAVKVEAWWGVDTQWRPMDRNSWLVGKVDAHVQDGSELIIIDHKTGRIYADKHEKQASLYTALGAAFYPKVKKVITEFWYLDQGETLTWSWPAAQLPGLQKMWGARGAQVMAPTNFEARPGYYCKWCPLSREHNNGPCTKG
jgi:hypothetical protein